MNRLNSFYAVGLAALCVSGCAGRQSAKFDRVDAVRVEEMEANTLPHWPLNKTILSLNARREIFTDGRVDHYLRTDFRTTTDFTATPGESLVLLVDGERYAFTTTNSRTVPIGRSGVATTLYVASHSKAAQDRLTADKAALDRVAQEKSFARKAELDKEATDQAAREKAVLEAAALGKLTPQKETIDRDIRTKTDIEIAALEKNAKDKIADGIVAIDQAANTEKIGAEKSVSEKLEAQKAAAENFAALKALADQAAAAPPPAPAGTNAPAVDPTTALRVAQTRVANAAKELEKNTAERGAAEKALQAVIDRIASEKAALQKSYAERVATDKAAIEKSMQERAVIEKANLERTALDKLFPERSTIERVSFDQAAFKKNTYDRPLFDKLAVDKAELDRKAIDQATLDAIVKISNAKEVRVRLKGNNAVREWGFSSGNRENFKAFLTKYLSKPPVAAPDPKPEPRKSAKLEKAPTANAAKAAAPKPAADPLSKSAQGTRGLRPFAL